MGGEPVATETVEFRLRGDGIAHGVARPGRVQTLDDARENVAVLMQVSEGRRVPMLLDIRSTGTLSREAREYYAGDAGAAAITALAFVANSAFTRVVGNFFIRLARTRYPVRLFDAEEPALSWLRSFDS
jgi:hypothetical protein